MGLGLFGGWRKDIGVLGEAFLCHAPVENLDSGSPVAVSSEAAQEVVLVLLGEGLRAGAARQARAALLQQQLRGSLGVQPPAQHPVHAAQLSTVRACYRSAAGILRIGCQSQHQMGYTNSEAEESHPVLPSQHVGSARCATGSCALWTWLKHEGKELLMYGQPH